MTALKGFMAKTLEIQLKEIEEMREYFRQPIMTGEFDYDKYKEDKKKAEEVKNWIGEITN